MEKTSDVGRVLDGASSNVAERVRAIRQRLPGQVRRERIQTAAAVYGPLHTRAQVESQVGDTLPPRFGQRRTAILEPIEQYRDFIPDEALLKFADATESGLFVRFWVARPAYRADAQADPWIIAEVDGADLFAVIARWD